MVRVIRTLAPSRSKVACTSIAISGSPSTTRSRSPLSEAACTHTPFAAEAAMYSGFFHPIIHCLHFAVLYRAEVTAVKRRPLRRPSFIEQGRQAPPHSQHTSPSLSRSPSLANEDSHRLTGPFEPPRINEGSKSAFCHGAPGDEHI